MNLVAPPEDSLFILDTHTPRPINESPRLLKKPRNRSIISVLIIIHIILKFLLMQI